MENHPELAEAHPASLKEILEERDKRSQRQQQYLSEYGCTLLCLTLNIPGPCKIFPLAHRAFLEEQRAVRLLIESEKLDLLHEEFTESPAGYVGYILVNSPPERLKELAIYIEETHLLGRLFDLDVIGSSGEKLSRKEERQCLICPEPAFVCGRSRAHEIVDLQNAVLGLMKDFFRKQLSENITRAALKALMAEVAITPKPGLVDRVNNGAHRDMDFFAFIDSTTAILPYFLDCASMGFDSNKKAPDLFDALRTGGKSAEYLMKKATGGANTHKGIIFSFALVCAAYGVLYRKNNNIELDNILDLCKAMTSRLLEDFSRPRGEASHGETAFARHGIQGIRGEAAGGFPSVRDHSYPTFKKMLKEGHSYNDAGIATFLSLLACVDDTNIVHRSDLPTLRRIQKETAEFLSKGPSRTAIIDLATKLDKQFIDENISPGGCADLLGLTFFLHELCNDIKRQPSSVAAYHQGFY